LGSLTHCSQQGLDQTRITYYIPKHIMLVSRPCTAAHGRRPAAAVVAVAPTQSRLLSRLAAAKSDAGTQTPDAAKNVNTKKSTDMEDFTWLKAQTPIKVFSGAQVGLPQYGKSAAMHAW
jgi:hypothetical protein